MAPAVGGWGEEVVAISQEGRVGSGKTGDKSTGQTMLLTEREFQKRPD